METEREKSSVRGISTLHHTLLNGIFGLCSKGVHHSRLKSERCVVVKENKEGTAAAKPECGVLRQRESFVNFKKR